MDKITANNHIVSLRKEIKKAKAMVSGNLIRKITSFKKDKEKIKDDSQLRKLDSKIENLLQEIKLLKTLDTYAIAKKITLNPDVNHWKKLIGDSKATTEDRLTARVLSKKTVLNQVAKFRSDNKDCDEWIQEYIELRDEKKSIVNTKNRTSLKKRQKS